ncbi:2-phosphosulfolactate phosphatase [Thermodesulfobacterium hydrogeniphilum]|uniref:2-phosphosulfolactate phosphatase n=1 Tax=Thermodesulfobacterium hydrogeniphilum TaxID=161156 RepID=UPI00056E4BF1|nr:2-phosphosulfolactate phosphatase [Thermodesulfobacterium hydrogeniphilum]
MEIYIISGQKGCEKVNELNGIAIIVDALRASATLAVLLEKGIKEIFVVSEVNEAWQLKKKIPEALLIGERNNFKIEGFDFSNSPSEIWKIENLKNKKAIFTSTSGARRIVSCKKATKILIGTTINASAIARIVKNYVSKYQKPVVIIPAGVYGKENFLSEEDLIGAWEIAKRLELPLKEYPEILISGFFKKSVEEIFLTSKHGLELIKAGLEKDVRFCSKIDITKKVPEVIEFLNKAAKLKEA